MELEPEDHRKLTKEGDIENIIFWTIIAVIVICILFAFFFDFFKILFFLVPRLIYISFFNPLYFLYLLGTVVIIGVGCHFASLFVKIFKLRKFQKIDENDEKILNNAIRKKISHLLQANIGTAYSKDALLKRVVEKVKHPYFKKYIKTNGEKVLKNLVSEEKILTAQKDGEIHYFTSPIIN